jgi:hypothetical protein
LLSEVLVSDALPDVVGAVQTPEEFIVSPVMTQDTFCRQYGAGDVIVGQLVLHLLSSSLRVAASTILSATAADFPLPISEQSMQ